MIDAPEPVLDYLGRLVDEITFVFGDRVVGVWTIGSLAYGGFGKGSDIDVQTAVEEPREVEALGLAERIVHPTLLCPAAGLEFVLYDRSELIGPTVPLRWALNVNGGPTRAVSVSTNHRSEPWHWFVLDLAIGRETAATLTGVDLADVVGPFTRRVQLEAIAASVAWHRHFDDGAPNQAANAARGLQYASTGRWTSKPDALRWLAAKGVPPDDAADELGRLLRVELGRPAASSAADGDDGTVTMDAGE